MSAIDWEALREVVTVHESDPRPDDPQMDMSEETHGAFGCVKDGVVENIIIIDTTDVEVIAHFKDLFDDLVLIQNPGVSGSPHIGWLQPGGPGSVLQAPPTPSISADPTTIPPDGVTVSTVTYIDPTDNPPTSVVFFINGMSSAPQPLVNGQAQLQVNSKTAGDTIKVKVEGVAVPIQVSVS